MRAVLARLLNIDFNLAILHSSGEFDNLISKFMIFLEGKANTTAPSLSTVPAALLASRLSKVFLINYSDTFENSKSVDTLHEVLA